MLKLNGYIKQISILTLCLVIIFTTFTTTYVKADEDIIKAVKNEIIPIKTVEPSGNLKDLKFLKEVLKDVDIVGMGEATHGTSEFFKMKHRVFRFLVEELGFRAFAIESNFGEGEIINDYISGKSSDEVKALNTFEFWTWKTDEVKEMLNWMRDYNLKVKDKNKIRFYGFDMQMMHNEHLILQKYLEKVKPDLQKKFLDTVSSTLTLQDENAKDLITKNKEVLTIIIKEFEASKEELIKNSSLEEYELMLKNLDIIDQYTNSFNYKVSTQKIDNTSFYKVLTFRDECMSKNVKWIKEREEKLGNGKIMLWAHNEHISNVEEKEFSFKWMGKNLKELYGDKYYSLGFEFFKGKFRAKDDKGVLMDHEKTESNAHTLGYMFNELNTPILYLNLKNKNPQELFKSKYAFINSIGAQYGKNHITVKRINITEAFDGIIFINETTAAKDPIFNPQGKCGSNNNEQINTTTIIATMGLLLIVILICFCPIKNTSK